MKETKNIAKKAWRLREDGNPQLAVALWTQLLYKFESEAKWEKAIDTLIEISIAYKNLSRQTGEPTYLETAKLSLGRIQNIAKGYKIPLRTDWYFYKAKVNFDSEYFEEAIENYNKYLNLSNNLTPEKKAEIFSHIGYSLAMIGRKEEGVKLLRESIHALENSTEKEVYEGKDVTAIWRTGAKMLLAKVLKDESKNESITLVKEALKEAKKENLGARVSQANKLLSTFS